MCLLSVKYKTGFSKNNDNTICNIKDIKSSQEIVKALKKQVNKNEKLCSEHRL